MATVNVDQISAAVMVADKVVPPFTTEVKQHVTDSIKLSQNLSITVNDIDLGAPYNADDGAYNAKLPVTFKASSGYRGTLQMAYMRYDLVNLLNGRDPDVLKYDKAMTRTVDILPVFNALFGTKVSAIDVVDEPIPLDGPCVLEAAATSIWFKPGTKATVGHLAPGDRDWEIPGLAWPNWIASRCYGMDFSAGKAQYEIYGLTGTVSASMQGSALVTVLNQTMATGLVAGRNATDLTSQGIIGFTWAIVTLPNADYPLADQSGRFNRCLILTPPANAWTDQPIAFHYNT